MIMNSNDKYEVFVGVFQVNTHLTPRPILLTRHGESRDNVRGRIGGDPELRFSFSVDCKFLISLGIS